MDLATAYDAWRRWIGRAGYTPWGIVRLFAARLVWGGVIGFLAFVALLALMWALAAHGVV